MRKFDKKILWKGNFLRIAGKQFIDKKGNKQVWECAERTNINGIVSIFAVTKNKEVIFTKQFRFPLESYIVELPAGLVDKESETFEETARRELLEETGYKAGKMIYVHEGPFNAGMTDNEIAVYYAPDAKYVGFEGAQSDDTEEIEVVKVPLRDIVDFCTKKHKDFKVDLKILGTLRILEEMKIV